VIGFLLDCLGRLFAVLPRPLAYAFCCGVGDLIYFGLKKKRRALLSNLHHAFPDKPRAWHLKTARMSCRRTVELGLFALVSPAFSQKRLRRHFTLGDNLKKELKHALETKESGVILVPHFSLMEALTTLPAHFDDRVRLRLTQVDKGSVVPIIERGSQLDFEEAPDLLGRAIDYLLSRTAPADHPIHPGYIADEGDPASRRS